MAKSKSKEKEETKAERFVRLATGRVNRVLKAMDILKNCSDPSNYEYTEEQVKKMLGAIAEEYEYLKNAFAEKKAEETAFKF